ncbi:MAG: T9SS type A sorting domain-containing protein [Crocinitomicaceae bacterium]|nr:T9SS type A sorting domain-containing protein [Crocinitomicaceae bacterium]
MKFSYFILLLVLLTLSNKAKSQYVTIPDPVFALYLNDVIPQCMSGNQLDTTCSTLATFSNMSIVAGIYGNPAYDSLVSVEGLQYFTSLAYLTIMNTSLAVFPANNSPIETIYLNNNNLQTIEALPLTLVHLHVSDNPNLSSVPQLPVGLQTFQRDFTPLLPLESFIPNTLNIYHAEGCNLTQFPPLVNIQSIFVNNNLITDLPDFSNHPLNGLSFENNLVSVMSTMPPQCYVLNISHNPISQIPDLPNSLIVFVADSCNIQCFPIFPNTISQIPDDFRIAGNPISCIPNYIDAMDSIPWLQNFPICSPNNIYGCPAMYGVLGEVRQDFASYCTFDQQDTGIVNVPIELKAGNITQISTTTFGSGKFQILTNNFGNYDVEIDTVNKPYVVNCSNPGISSSVTISSSDTVHQHINFLVDCPPLNDPGIQSIYKEGLVFPSLEHQVTLKAGELSAYYGLNCNINGGGGVIEVNVSGPIDTITIPVNALPAIVNGNSVTYAIPDFSQLTFDLWELWMEIKVDTTATIGDSICVSATLIPDSTDYQLSNNVYTFCYEVSNSYDPNMKEVYPSVVEPGYNEWLNYTIHFQNTGNAPAINIRLEDTLASSLDISTVEFIGGSHPFQVTASQNRLSVYFRDIYLPDSTSDPQGSKGYFQFRIKPVENLPAYSLIGNRAFIFFDFNEPIMTNTATTYFKLHAGLTEVESSLAKLFPNPNSGSFNLMLNHTGEHRIDIYNTDGRSISSFVTQDQELSFQLQNELDPGLYLLLIQNEESSETIRFIVE